MSDMTDTATTADAKVTTDIVVSDTVLIGTGGDAYPASHTTCVDAAVLGDMVVVNTDEIVGTIRIASTYDIRRIHEYRMSKTDATAKST